MIISGSRYEDGAIVTQPDRTVWVERNHKRPTGRHVLYTWQQSDRIDRIAARFLGDPTLWWRILDENPLVQDVHDITPGEQIRIPRNA